MGQILISEFERIFDRKKTKVLIVIFGLLLILHSVWVHTFGVAIYDTKGTEAILSNLNFPVAVTREWYFTLFLLIFPILFIDSFNSEISSGAYRLIMIRPVSRWELLLAKWITQMSIVSLFLLIAFIESYVYGTFFIRHAEETFFLDKQVIYGTGASILYTLKYYLILWFIASALLMLSSFVSLWFQNAIITYFVIVGLLVAGLYVNEEISYFVIGSESILRILSEGKVTFYLINGTILGGCAIAAMFSWRKKDVFN
ncbi:ABC transporter permease [Bacillus cereus]|uniref:ABC transporter permease n=1 Tax=Bacillus paramycoides TaxID=2026194 RepID=A0A1J9UST4_9BACI|nr:ABC transporter permease [Bacillus paramycoides]PFM64074.1 ABC transporter permease [Bacillus cereus]MED0967559.1 ABC transporter permease [Bacillus paramycoides]MED0969946.1 ABC transporter permease [Bacillus paramycoides]MED1092322.1 ABC transporter permease [Bacillus paramycoides]MED1103819.1 ABC transporter permease [Bacillus paramycoides]